MTVLTRVLIISDNMLAQLGLKQIVDSREWQSQCVDFVTIRCDNDRDWNSYDLIVASVGLKHELQTLVPLISDRFEDTPTVLVLEDDSLGSRLGNLPSSFRAVVTSTYCPNSIQSVLDLVVKGAFVFPKEFFSTEGISRGADAANLSNARDLTKREVQILQNLAEGMPNKEIGRKLSISCNTVDTHVSSIIKKLKVRNRTEAAVYARSVEHNAPEAPAANG